MTRFRAVCLSGLLIGLLWIGVGRLPANAQESINEVLKEAIQFLSKQLGKPIPVVDNYTYEPMTFTDEAMGCPELGKVYQPLSTQGYKFLLTVSGITYDVRIALDGNHAVLCSGAGIKQASALALYRGALFSVPYPNQWRPNDRGSDIFFGIGPSPVCSQPGMTVAALGKVAAEKTLDNLIDDYAQTITGEKLESARNPIGNIGRSVLYSTPCTDGSLRQGRITAFISFGRAYRIVQYAPQAGFEQWADIYLDIVNKFSPVSSNTSSSEGQAVTQPDRSPLALLAHVFAGNVYIGTLVDIPGKPITEDATSDHNYRDVVIAPNGSLAAFIDAQNAALYVANTGGDGEPKQIADGLAANYPAAWKADGSEIAYLVDSGTQDRDRAIYSMMAVKPAGGTPRKIGDTQGILTGCTPNTTDPAERLYWSDAGPNGNGLLFAWAQNGTLYYSLGCDGIGIGEMSSDGTKRDTVDAGIKRAQLSPDRTALLGITADNALVHIQLSDRTITKLTTAAPPDQVAWSPDGKAIYYSTATPKATLTLDSDIDKERGIQTFGVWPFLSVSYTVALHRLDLTTNQDLPLYQAAGRAIGHIAPSPDGSGVLFTFIQDASHLVEAFKNNVPSGDLRREAPNALLYWLSFSSPQPQLLAVTLDPTWGPLGSALAPTPTGSAKSATGVPPTIQPTLTPPPRSTLPPTNTKVPTPLPGG